MTPLWVAHLSLDSAKETNMSGDKTAETRSQGHDISLLVKVSRNLDMYYIPVLLITGLSLHIFCCIVFTKTRLYRRFFTQLFLGVSIADIGFLSTLSLLWLNDFGLQVYTVPGVCPIVIFASYYFPFLSLWLTVTAAVILVLQPFVGCVNKFAGGKGHGKIVVLTMAVFSFIVYLYKTWTYGVLDINGRSYCTVLRTNTEAMKVLNVFDVLFLLFFPFLGAVVFDVLVIIMKTGLIYRCRRKSGPLMRCSRDALRVICAESIGFIVLVGPGCLSKFVLHVINGHVNGDTHIRDLLLQNLFQFCFYTYFAITPLLHISASKSFRNQVRFSVARQKTRTVHCGIDEILQAEPHSDQTLL